MWRRSLAVCWPLACFACLGGVGSLQHTNSARVGGSATGIHRPDQSAQTNPTSLMRSGHDHPGHLPLRNGPYHQPGLQHARTRPRPGMGARHLGSHGCLAFSLCVFVRCGCLISYPFGCLNMWHHGMEVYQSPDKSELQRLSESPDSLSSLGLLDRLQQQPGSHCSLLANTGVCSNRNVNYMIIIIHIIYSILCVRALASQTRCRILCESYCAQPT